MDGSTLRLIKDSPEIAVHFGEAECRQGTSPPLARMCYLYEVRSNLIVAAEISPTSKENSLTRRNFWGNVFGRKTV